MRLSKFANWSSCVNEFYTNTTLIDLYRFQDAVRWGSDNGTYVTTAGCEAVCGSRPHTFEWEAIAFTLTTWVIPIVGLLMSTSEPPLSGLFFVKH